MANIRIRECDHIEMLSVDLSQFFIHLRTFALTGRLCECFWLNRFKSDLLSVTSSNSATQPDYLVIVYIDQAEQRNPKRLWLTKITGLKSLAP